MSDLDDLRSLLDDEPDVFSGSGFEQDIVTNVSEGKIFGLTAGERMILSVIVFMAVTGVSIALLLATNTVVFQH
jgi:hypothetical protein